MEEELRTKALTGNLSQGELNTFRGEGSKDEALVKSFLSKLRLLRNRGESTSWPNRGRTVGRVHSRTSRPVSELR